MCGIAGILNISGAHDDMADAVRRMTGAQNHRGPDAEGFFSDSLITLGHRRLSIIDLSSGANQPMQDHSGRYVITFNGEIYNHQHLQLKLAHYPFRTHSDTEVILAAFNEWGADCVGMFKGQFAFAIWDRTKKKLFIARDRLGEKPFYYYRDGSRFAFASELRALLKSGIVPKKLSPPAVADYLANESVRSPATIIEGVKQLPAAHHGWVAGGELTITRYWDILGTSHSVSSDNDYKAVCGRVKELLHGAIGGQMISDVPLGVFLSGGIDSSAIVGLMAEHSSRKVNTLSITFDDARFDESKYSSLIARRFDTEHQEIRLQPQRLLDELPEYFDRIDIPSGDGPNVYIVSKEAKKAGLSVALSGIGGDELFAGYGSFRWYYTFMTHRNFWSLPKALKGAAGRLAGLLPIDMNAGKLARLFALDAGDAEAFYHLTRSSFLDDELPNMFADKDAVHKARLSDMNRVCTGDFLSLPILSQYSALEFVNYTQNVLLKDADNMAMANSLEIRVPFCDHELLEYVFSVPDPFKYPSRPKRLLIDSLGGLLPDEIVNRPKMGFSFPWGKWIKEDLRTFCDESLKIVSACEMFDGREIDRMWNRYCQQEGYRGWNRIWLLVTLGQWLRNTGIQVVSHEQ